jgi:hypothetical protein
VWCAATGATKDFNDLFEDSGQAQIKTLGFAFMTTLHVSSASSQRNFLD